LIAGYVVLALLVTLVGIVAGLGALLGAATITDQPPLFLLAGFLAFCVADLLGLLLVTRKVNTTRRRVRLISFCAGPTLAVGAFALTALIPLGDPQLPPAPVEGQRFWELPTGSRIAYVRVPAEDRAPEAPVIFLHGGPGVPDMRGDSEYFERISRDGFDVYVYDMVGRGRSPGSPTRAATLWSATSRIWRPSTGRSARRRWSSSATPTEPYSPPHTPPLTQSAWRRWSYLPPETPRLRQAGRACSSGSARKRS
jgi:hypothetical protein